MTIATIVYAWTVKLLLVFLVVVPAPVTPQSSRIQPADLFSSSSSSTSQQPSTPSPSSQSTPNFHFNGPVSYRDPVLSEHYRSRDSFEPKGMEHLYLVTDIFLDAVRPALPPQDAFPNTTAADLVQKITRLDSEAMWYYVRFVSLALLGLLLAVAVPVAGFFFCVCRCTGRCGSPEPPNEKDFDSCKRFTLGVFLAVLIVIILFGIVCAFVTNEYFEDQVQHLVPTVDTSLDDLNLYLNNTRRAVDNLFVDNFLELQNQLDLLLDHCGERVKTRLAEISRAVAIENLTNIVIGLEKVRIDLENILKNTLSLRDLGQQLDKALTGIRNMLNQHLNSCFDEICLKIKREYDITLLSVRPEIWELPDVSGITTEISRLIREDITNEVSKGKKALDGISDNIQRAVNNTVPEIRKVIRNVGFELQRLSADIGRSLMKVNIQTNRNKLCIKPECNPEVDRFIFIRYYVGLTMCLALLLITFFIVSGLFCGFCGRKPSIYGDDSCTKGTGARFLMVAIYVIFLTYLFLMALTVALFVIGGLTQHIICDPLVGEGRDPNLQGTNYVLKALHLFSDDKWLYDNAPEVIQRCHQNMSIYEVMQLQRKVDIDDIGDYKRRFRIEEKISDLTRRVNLQPGITLLTPQAKEQLHQLADSQISDIDFGAYLHMLDQGIVGMNLMELARVLNDTARLLPQFAHDLNNEAIKLEGFHQRLVVPMLGYAERLKKSLQSLQEDIRFNKSSFREAVYDLISQSERAQQFIKNDGRQQVINLAQELANDFTLYIDDYADRATVQVKENIGKCWPVSQAFNSTTSVACKSILLPFNGFWASVGWCILLFVPVLIIAAALAELYKKTEPYSIPLTESQRNKKHRRNKKTQSYDNQNGYVHGYSLGLSPVSPTAPPATTPAAPRHSSSSNSRYEQDQPRAFRNIPVKPSSSSSTTENTEGISTDWDLVSDPPPPRYSSATNLSMNEFERPPPYYFPGPGPDFNKY